MVGVKGQPKEKHSSGGSPKKGHPLLIVICCSASFLRAVPRVPGVTAPHFSAEGLPSVEPSSYLGIREGV